MIVVSIGGGDMIKKTPKIRQVVDMSVEDYQTLVETAEALGVGNPETIRRAVRLLHRMVKNGDEIEF
jgi:transposase-like protein